jgi:hypothetical protein
MRVATPEMVRSATPAQKEAPWVFDELVIAAAGAMVDDDVAEIAAKLGEMLDAGTVAVATVPDDICEIELSGDGESVPADEGGATYGL